MANKLPDNIMLLPMKHDCERISCVIDATVTPTDRTLCGASCSHSQKNNYDTTLTPTGEFPRMGNLDDISCPHCRAIIAYIRKILNGENTRPS